ncbi:hypothetical protein CAPTEDRAFT_219487 [Capitella teleta]|uniref:SUEL-type lectin domain-containing protein n=1 Tax=Capitella teleta TaxID=283909 RepID=X2APM5_CAPTE|nr:hypothetical protein CAPTEDRAFT_219487 [Capitella teleta]|eukprot:ELU10132.1 hypothetical protein CAPTEDRAFT_219487 [Capitella teleta]
MAYVVKLVKMPVANDVKEYCENEVFSPKCEEGEVVIMTSARYGRMKLGRCLETSYGSEGCQVTALSIMDRKCSGRPSCEVKISDLVSELDTPCKRDLRSYMDASYRCVPVITSPTKCVSLPLQVSSPSGFISNYIASDSGCGDIDSPWRVVVKPGQTVNITLYDFSTTMGGDSRDVAKTCQVFAVIKDSRGSKTICGRTGPRVGNVYKSFSNEVEIRLVARWKEENPAVFLLHYSAMGCANLPVDAETTFMRTTNGAEISCADQRRWTMTCENNAWKGSYSNCSREGIPRSDNVVSGSLMSLPYGVSVALMVGVALIIGVVILIIGLYIIRRRREHQTPPGPGSLSQRIDKEKGELYMHQGYPPSDRPYCSSHGGKPYQPRRGENTYYCTWDAHQHSMQPSVGAHGQMAGYPPYQPPSSLEEEPDRYGEHIYESPKSIRRDINRDMLQYYELENDELQRHNALRQDT